MGPVAPGPRPLAGNTLSERTKMTQLDAKGRDYTSAILRMSGNIAGGMVTRPDIYEPARIPALALMMALEIVRLATDNPK